MTSHGDTCAGQHTPELGVSNPRHLSVCSVCAQTCGFCIPRGTSVCAQTCSVCCMPSDNPCPPIRHAMLRSSWHAPGACTHTKNLLKVCTNINTPKRAECVHVGAQHTCGSLRAFTPRVQHLRAHRLAWLVASCGSGHSSCSAFLGFQGLGCRVVRVSGKDRANCQGNEHRLQGRRHSRACSFECTCRAAVPQRCSLLLSAPAAKPLAPSMTQRAQVTVRVREQQYKQQQLTGVA